MNEDNPLARLLGAPARWLAILTGWWLLLFSLVTCVEILGRKLAGFSLQGVDEIGAYTTAVVSTLAFAWALVNKAHTRVDFLLANMPAWLRAVLNAAAYALLAGLAVFATLRGWSVLEESIEFDAHSVTPLGTPLWIPQSLWFFGFAFFALVAILLALHAAWLLLADRARLNRLYGPMTLDEEVATEAGAVMQRTAGKDAAP